MYQKDHISEEHAACQQHGRHKNISFSISFFLFYDLFVFVLYFVQGQSWFCNRCGNLGSSCPGHSSPQGTNSAAGSCLTETKANSHQARTNPHRPQHLLINLPMSCKTSSHCSLHFSWSNFQPWTPPSKHGLLLNFYKFYCSSYKNIRVIQLLFASLPKFP